MNPLAGFLKPLSPASATATASASSTNSSSSAQAEPQGALELKNEFPTEPSEEPSNPKIIPQTPSRTEIENLIDFLKVWSRSDREPTEYGSGQSYTCAHARRHTVNTSERTSSAKGGINSASSATYSISAATACAAWYVASLVWTHMGYPCDSMRLAVFTARVNNDNASCATVILRLAVFTVHV